MNREDMVGRIMAHAFQNELEKIAGIDAVAYKLFAPLRRAEMNSRTPLELLTNQNAMRRLDRSLRPKVLGRPSDAFQEAFRKSIEDNAPAGAKELRRRANQLAIKQK